MVHKGSAQADGSAHGGWFVGDQRQPGERHRKNALIKYGTHKACEVCKSPHDPTKGKVNISILIDGGPFVHSFKKKGIDQPDATLEKVGDYIIYGPEVTHTWKAMKDSVVLTVQVPPDSLISRVRAYAEKRWRQLTGRDGRKG